VPAESACTLSPLKLSSARERPQRRRSMAASVTKVYLGVIQDVVDKVRRELEDEGKGEDAPALQELQEVRP